MCNEVIKLLENLVAIDSPYFEEEDVMEYVCQIFEEQNIPVKVHAYYEEKITGFHGKNLLIEASCGKEGPTIHINGHLDTVKLCDGWSKNPCGEMIEDRFYGVGALDMKSGCAAAIAAVQKFLKTYKAFKGRLLLSLVSVEEGPYGMGTNAMIEDGLLADIDYSIITEPSAGFTGNAFPTMCLGARGGYGLTVEFYGKSAHAADPQKGSSAALDASKFVAELENINYVEDDKLGKGAACVVAIDCDGGACSVPDKAVVKLFWHIVRGESPQTIEAEIKKALDRAAVKCRYEICFREAPSEGSKGFMPYVTEENNLYTRDFAQAVRDVTGKEANISYFQSIGDFNYLGTRLGAPALIFGPDGENYHSADEYVQMDTVVQTAEILYRFLEKTMVN